MSNKPLSVMIGVLLLTNYNKYDNTYIKQVSTFQNYILGLTTFVIMRV
jgi:hypothetical protein